MKLTKLGVESLKDKFLKDLTGHSDANGFLLCQDWLTLHAEVERLTKERDEAIFHMENGPTMAVLTTVMAERDAALAKGRLEGAEAMKNEMKRLKVYMVQFAGETQPTEVIDLAHIVALDRSQVAASIGKEKG